MKISELAAATGCAAETIRFYEQQGLLPQPRRSAGNYRMYGAAHAARLRFIRNCRYLDMALDEIRRLLALCDSPQQSCHEVNALLDEHVEHVGERIRELRVLEKDLKQLRLSCHVERATKDCGILHELGASTAGGSKAREATHVRGTHGRTR